MCGTRFGRMGISIRTFVCTPQPTIPPFYIAPTPKPCPSFIPKEKLADFLEGYAVGQEIHVSLSSTVLSTPIYNDATKRWTVEIDRAGKPCDPCPEAHYHGHRNGKAKIPTWPGMDLFAGLLYHSDSHTGAALFKGKRVIVVGACNAAGDICHNFVNKGAAEVTRGSVYLLMTMIQHGATCVISSAAADKALFSAASSERQTIEDIDFVNHSMPHALLLELVAGGGTKRLKEMDQKLHDDLTKAGFKLTWELAPGDGEFLNSSDLAKRTASGTLLDMGCGQLIVEGKVKVKQGVEIEKLESDGMGVQRRFKDSGRHYRSCGLDMNQSSRQCSGRLQRGDQGEDWI
ncbi:hypothetical protein B0H14DRAFT_3568864 [Mycena olivaceomarginata]|nr:hypothetical protein B0H14DRAFT_3568864 [Mycena olivaceomarginata]